MIEIKPFSPSSIPEEVFASNGAIWWSTTGKYFAYAEFNDTEVQKVEFSWYGSGQYPETRAIPYPKVRLEDSACVRKTSTFREKLSFLVILLLVGTQAYRESDVLSCWRRQDLPSQR